MLGASSCSAVDAGGSLSPSLAPKCPSPNSRLQSPSTQGSVCCCCVLLMGPEMRSPAPGPPDQHEEPAVLVQAEKPLCFQGDPVALASCLWWPARWVPSCHHNGPAPGPRTCDATSRGQRVSSTCAVQEGEMVLGHLASQGLRGKEWVCVHV